ncbi:MAG: peptide ABC transporter substrate-binding protein [Clostridia bacterium]|nr:peptide ABC transporter substrate-binding protein [Clostridia bacterium]
MHKRILAALAAVCLMLCGLTACGDDGTGAGFRFPLEAEPAGLDPQMATDTASITAISTLFEGLTRLDETGNAVPGAAQWTVSEDGLTYTFTLFESYWCSNQVKGQESPWDQPTPVTADDFLFAFQRAVDPVTGSPLAAEFYGIRNAEAVHTGQKPMTDLGVTAVDERTLVIALTTPDHRFLVKLAGTPFMPCNRAFFEHTAGRYGLEKEYVLSNGAFRLVAWNHNESLLFYKHEQYHAAAEIAPEAVRYVIGTADPVEALRTGGLDAAPLPAGQTADTMTSLQDTLRGLWFNTTASPFTVAAIRRSLRDSIEWETLHHQLVKRCGEQPATGFVPPEALVGGTEKYRAPDNALPYGTDKQAALEAMQTGLGLLYPDGGKLRFELLAADDPLSADLARYVVQSWHKNLQVYPTVTLLPAADLERRVKSGNYQAAIYTFSPTGLTGAENLSCFASAATNNIARLQDAGIDTAIRDALAGGRVQLETLEKKLWELCPCVPLSYPERYYGVADGTEHIIPLPFGGGRYNGPLYFRNALKWD